MKRARAAAIVAAVAISCGGERDDVPFATYKGEPNADDAALAGRIEFEHGRCLYVLSEDGERTLVALPAVATSWDAENVTLRLNGVPIRDDDSVVFGGSGLAQPLTALNWQREPDSACDTTRVWVASDSVGQPRP